MHFYLYYLQGFKIFHIEKITKKVLMYFMFYIEIQFFDIQNYE